LGENLEKMSEEILMSDDEIIYKRDKKEKRESMEDLLESLNNSKKK
jgi:hypothetical protein